MRRVLAATLAALVLAAGLTIRTGWSPLCVLYTPDDAMWFILLCWVDPPPPHPPEG